MCLKHVFNRDVVRDEWIVSGRDLNLFFFICADLFPPFGYAVFILAVLFLIGGTVAGTLLYNKCHFQDDEESRDKLLNEEGEENNRTSVEDEGFDSELETKSSKNNKLTGKDEESDVKDEPVVITEFEYNRTVFKAKLFTTVAMVRFLAPPPFFLLALSYISFSCSCFLGLALEFPVLHCNWFKARMPSFLVRLRQILLK